MRCHGGLPLRNGWAVTVGPGTPDRDPRVQDPATGEWFNPYTDDFGNELDCTHCCGEGTCDDNTDPLWDCDDNLHPCHACGGSGLRRDQRIF